MGNDEGGRRGRGAAVQRSERVRALRPSALEDEEPSAAGTMSIQLRRRNSARAVRVCPRGGGDRTACAAGEHKHGHVVGTGAGGHAGQAFGGRELVEVGREAPAFCLPSALDGAECPLFAVDRYATSGLFGQGGDAPAPVFQSRIELSARRHDDMQAPQGVDGHERPVDQDLLGGRGDEVGAIA